jgi:hypothetical protein
MNHVGIAHALHRFYTAHHDLPHAHACTCVKQIVLVSSRILPNIHTSLDAVNRRKLIDSGAIHLIGSLPFDAATRIKQWMTHLGHNAYLCKTHPSPPIDTDRSRTVSHSWDSIRDSYVRQYPCKVLSSSILCLSLSYRCTNLRLSKYDNAMLNCEQNSSSVRFFNVSALLMRYVRNCS